MRSYLSLALNEVVAAASTKSLVHWRIWYPWAKSNCLTSSVGESRGVYTKVRWKCGNNMG